MKLIGDWDRMSRMLHEMPVAYSKNMDKSIKKIALKIQKSMITGTTTKRFNLAPNAQSTIDAKGSSTPLIDKGDLMGSINIIKVSDGYLVGAHKNARNRKGDSLINIFAVLTYGVDIVTKNGIISIPPRDIITPAILENQELFQKEVRESLRKTLRW